MGLLCTAISPVPSRPRANERHEEVVVFVVVVFVVVLFVVVLFVHVCVCLISGGEEVNMCLSLCVSFPGLCIVELENKV